MPTPPEHPPEPTRDDELARLYLAGRDVPCPKCRYNRRDSDRAACPECGHRLELTPPDPIGRAYVRAGRVLGVALSLDALTSLGSAAWAVWFITQNGWAVMGWNAAMYAFVAPLAIAKLTVGATLLLRRPFREPHNARGRRRYRRAVMVGLWLTVLTAALGLVNWVRWGIQFL